MNMRNNSGQNVVFEVIKPFWKSAYILLCTWLRGHDTSTTVLVGKSAATEAFVRLKIKGRTWYDNGDGENDEEFEE